MKEWLKKHKIAVALLFVITIQLGYITYMFAFEKEGFHSDDGWGYQFANANYDTCIYMEGDDFANENKWVDSQVFRDFVEVQKGQEFNYDAVLYNMSEERNPPLNALLLHTVCSFFPDSFSWWYAYGINAVSFVLIMISLYFLAREMIQSRKVAFIVCLFYGFTTAALNTTLFLRMYSLLTVFGILCLFLHCRMYRKGFQNVALQLAGLFVVMVLGYLCHYSFLMFGLALSVVFGVYTLCTKRWRFTLLYGAVMVLSVVTLMLLWPQSVQLFLERDELYIAQMPLGWEIRYCVLLWFREATGIPFRFPSIVFWTYMESILIYVIIFAGAIAFLLRKETYFRKFVKKVWNRGKHFFQSIPGRVRKMNKCYLLCFFSCIITLVIIAKLCNIFVMGIYADRYLFFIMPALTVVLIEGIYLLLKKIIKKKRVLNLVFGIVLTAGLVSNHLIDPSGYLFPRNCEGETIEELTKEANVIMVIDSDWKMVWFAPLLLDSENFFAVAARDVMEVTKELEELGEGKKPVYLIVQKDAFLPEDWERDESLPDDILANEEILTYGYKISDVVTQYSRMTWSTECTHVQDEAAFVGELSIWKLR